jgi:hypothetical protein
MATAAEIADLITQGMQGPTGPDDSGWHVGRIVTWSSSTGLNSVLVNNTLMTNLRALAPSVGTEYYPGQSVLIVRKQTQYFILGQVQVPGAAGSTPPTQVDAAGGVLTGSSASWRDLDAGGSSPAVSVTLAPFQRVLFMFGCAWVRNWGCKAQISLQVISPPGTNRMATPGSITGMTAQHENQISLAAYTGSPLFKTFFAFASSGKTDPTTEILTPGVNQVRLKYWGEQITSTGGGSPTVTVGTPWLLAIPF